MTGWQASFSGDWAIENSESWHANTSIYARLNKSLVLRAVSLLLADGKISIICKVVPDFCENYKN